MSKRVNTSNDKPPPKRPRGFRLAQTFPETTPPLPSTSSLFVTVNPADDSDQHSSKLKGHSRVIHHSLPPSGPSVAPTPETASESHFNPHNNDVFHPSGQMEDMDPSTPRVPDNSLNPKRKRFTANAVCSGLKFEYYSYSDFH